MHRLRHLLFILCLPLSFNGWTGSFNPELEKVQGKFPIQQPSYQGIEQLLVLSDRWVVVVTSNRDQLLQMLDKASNGTLTPLVQEWKERKARHDHRTYIPERKIAGLVNEHWISFREQTGEHLLDDPAHYTILSKSDPSYRTVTHPSRVVHTIVIQGKEPVPGFAADFAHYSYLQLPQPLQTGQQYTIDLGNNQSVSFVYDELETVSRLIKVNQLGYLPNTPHKYAYLGGYLPGEGPLSGLEESKSFYVIDAESGAKVIKGPVQLREKDPRFLTDHRQPISGEDIYQLDLSALQTPGNYFIVVPGVGRSWPFQVSDRVYGPAFYHAARGLYHQRCGDTIGPPYSNWPRGACHQDPIYESEHVPFTANIRKPNEYARFDVIAGSLDTSRKTKDGTGGWHDAADWDRRIEHFVALFDLLNAYSFAPEKFLDGQLNIPESGNGIPDILDEAEYGLRVWRKSMDERGGVAGAVETWSHPYMNDPNYKWAYSQRTRWSSLLYAAGAAYYAQLVQPFNRELAQVYEESARKAYAFGSSLKHLLNAGTGNPITIHAKKDRGRGAAYTIKWEETPDHAAPYLIAAKLHLFRLTGEKLFLEATPGYPESDISSLLKYELQKNRGPYQRPFFGDQDVSPWLYFSIFAPELRKHISPQVKRLFEVKYLQHAQQLYELSTTDPYRRSKGRSQYGKMSWGFGTLTNQARQLLIGYLLSGDERFRETALYNLDYMLGTNPMGMVWTTGLGWVYPVHIHHRVSDTDGIDDPVPGIAIYGPNVRRPWRFDHIWRPKNKEGEEVYFVQPETLELPLLRRWFSHPYFNVSQNEFTIHETIAAGIFAYAFFLPEKWMPSPELIHYQPRDKASLFGQWYLP